MRKAWLAMGLLGVVLAPATVHAEAIVTVTARSSEANISANSSSVPAVAGAAHVSGRASAGSEASAVIVSGPLSSCGVNGGGVGCGVQGPLQGRGFASANGNNGTLSAAASADSSSQARGQGLAALRDLIVLTSPIIDFSIHLNEIGFPAGTTAVAASLGLSAFSFIASVKGPLDPEITPAMRLFTAEGSKTAQGEIFRYGSFNSVPEGNPEATLSEIPNIFNYTLDLSGSPVEFFAALGPLDLTFSLTATADCAIDDCFAHVSLENTVYIQLDGVSLNGYDYPGFSPAATAVPEPPSSSMALLGFLLLVASLGFGASRKRDLRKCFRVECSSVGT